MVQPLGSGPQSDGVFPGWQSPISHEQASVGITRAKFGDDHRLSVRFYMRPSINEFKTEQNLNNGIFKKEIDYTLHVRIQPIGDRTTVYDQPAQPRHISRFPVQYEHFKSGRQELVGIPLEAWDYQLSEREILTFKILGIEYVHQIAAMNDVQQNSLGIDAKNIMARAKLTVLETSEKEAAAQLQAKFDAVNEESAELRKELDRMKEENAAIMALMRRAETNAGAKEVSLAGDIEKAVKRKGRQPGSKNKPKAVTAVTEG